MDLETRLIKLERSNRRLQGIIAGLAAMLLVSLFFGGKLVSQTDAAAQSGKKTIEANELIIKNRNGDPIVVLRGDAPRNENPGIQITGNTSVFECFDEANRKTVSIGVANGDVAWKGGMTKIR